MDEPTADSAVSRTVQRDPGFADEADGEFLEHVRREQIEQPDLPWDL